MHTDVQSKYYKLRNRLVLQPRVDPVRQAVQRLARKELLSFAAAVRRRTYLGKPTKQDAQNDVQKDGFAQTVDKDIQEFQPDIRLTGVMCCLLLRLYVCLDSVTSVLYQSSSGLERM